MSFSYVPTAPIVVTNGGLLNASNTAFTGYGRLYLTQIYRQRGRPPHGQQQQLHLLQVYLDNGSILNAGDLVGNSFNTPLFLSAADVQYLSGADSNNAQFNDIDILAGTLTSGQTLALNAIGTASTANLRYVFSGNFTVSSGATLTVAANVSVVIPYNVTLTDSGTADLQCRRRGEFQLRPDSADRGHQRRRTQCQQHRFHRLRWLITLREIYVDGGGHFTASNSSFTYIQVYLDNGSILNAGDLVGNSFNTNLFLSAADVQYLSGAGSNNAQFNDIDILAGTLTSGTLALNAIGTASTANLRYVFSGNFTVSSGATLTVAANVKVAIAYNVTLTDSGTATFNAGDAVSFSYAPTAQIVVSNGGVLDASGTAFTGYGANNQPRSRRRRRPPHRPATAPSPPPSTKSTWTTAASSTLATSSATASTAHLFLPESRRAVSVGRRQQQRSVPEHRHPGGQRSRRPDAGAERHRHGLDGQPALRLRRQLHGRQRGRR